MKRKFQVATVLLTLLGLVLLSGCGSKPAATTAPAPATGSQPQQPAQPTPPPKAKVSIIVGGIDKIIYLPGALTQALGYFQEQNLDVSLANAAAGQVAEEALLSGQVDGVIGFYDHTIDMASKGKKLVEVTMFDSAPGEVVVVSKANADKIKTLADLKGKKIGVTGLGSSTQFLATTLVVKGGGKPTDYTPVAVGAGDTFIAAMKQGKIDAGVTTEPTVSLILKNGDGQVFVDMRDMQKTKDSLGGSYPAASLYMSADYVAKNPDVVQRVVNAFVKTLKYIQTHSPEEIAAKVPKDFYAGDQALYTAALKASMPMFSPDGKMPADGPQGVYNVQALGNKDIAAAKIDLNATFTDQFVDKANATLK